MHVKIFRQGGEQVGEAGGLARGCGADFPQRQFVKVY